MRVNEVIRYLVDNAGTNCNAAAALLGRSREYVRNAAARPSPSLATVTDVANVCGCDVLLRDRRTGSEAAITPPRRTGLDGAECSPRMRG